MLTVKDNYLYENDKPFFWQGDTAWLLFDRLSEDEIKRYLLNRHSLGYNVIQSVLVYSLPDAQLENGLKNGIRNPRSKEYWEFISNIIDYAKSLGMYFALLPCWGHFVKDGTVNENNALEFATFLAKYFENKENIIWVIGGDVRGDQNFECFNILGSTLKKLNRDKIVTFHPFGRTGSYLWFNDQDWLDMNMFQSGHRRYDQTFLGAWDDKANGEDVFGEDNWKYVAKNNSYKNKKPCLDAEPSYEGIVQGLHDEHEPYWEARDIRRYAYWSVLEGACGFTYGHNAIIQFYDGHDKRTYGVREMWTDALHAPGAAQMQYLKNLMLSLDFTKGKAHPELCLNQKERYHRTSVFSSDEYIVCYNFMGDLIKLDMRKYKHKKMDLYFMNPENDSLSFDSTIEGLDEISIRPVKRYELSNDWVILLKEHK